MVLVITNRDVTATGRVIVSDMGKVGYVVWGKQSWLYHSLGEGWTAAYRMTYQGQEPNRRARIVELRIVPAGPAGIPRHGVGAFNPDKRDVLPWALTAPLFSFDAIRRGITARHFRDALTSMTTLVVQEDPEEERDGPVSRLQTPTGVRRGGGRPPTHSRAFYATLAVDYDDVEHSSRKEPGASTRAILAKRRRVPVTTIGKWILTARRLGFLTAVARGQRGGRATPTAYNLSTQGQK